MHTVIEIRKTNVCGSFKGEQFSLTTNFLKHRGTPNPCFSVSAVSANDVLFTAVYSHWQRYSRRSLCVFFSIPVRNPTKQQMHLSNAKRQAFECHEDYALNGNSRGNLQEVRCLTTRQLVT